MCRSVLLVEMYAGAEGQKLEVRETTRRNQRFYPSSLHLFTTHKGQEVKK